MQDKVLRCSGQLLGRKCRTAKREADTRERSPVGGGVEEVWEELRVSHVPRRRARLLLLSQRGLSSRGGGRRLEEDVHVIRKVSWNSWNGEIEDVHWNSRDCGSVG